MTSALFTCLLLVSTARVDVAVEGDGYFRFAREGEEVYAKSATLTVRSGKLCSVDGPWVLPVILVEGEPKSITVDLNGKVSFDYGNGPAYAGRILLSKFSDDIRPVESRGFLLAYDKPILGEANDDGFGKILSGDLLLKSAESRVTSAVKSNTTSEKKPEENRIKVYEPEAPEKIAVVKPDLEFLKRGGVQIVLPDSITISGERIRLGEIATVYANASLSPEISALDLGAAPMFGVPRLLASDRIEQALKLAGLKSDMIRIVGSRVSVKIDSQVVTQADFEKVASEAARERFGDIEVESDRPVPDLEVPKGELQLVAENLVKSGNSVSVSVTVYVDGKRINSRSIKLYNTSVPLTLKNGDKVTVVILANDVSVEVTGKVRRIDGVTGDITVLLDTGSEVVGRVNKKGFVEVKA